jgi:dephospho-CoA kinase
VTERTPEQPEEPEGPEGAEGPEVPEGPGVRGPTGRPFLVGLSGPIGCGKSTVARMLVEIGGTVIDADALARRATAPGTDALPRIRQRFGDAVFRADGTLDRAALGQMVFSDPAALAELEQIVHPPVRGLVEEALAKAATDRAPFVVLEAIKLVEGGLADRCDEVWLLECDPETQRSRLRDRGMAIDDIDRRLSAQGDRLVDRLAAQLEGRAVVRRLSTEGTAAATRERVEDALANALAPLLLE